MPRALAAASASCMLCTQYASSVPMFKTSDWAIPAISATSSWACAITGAAPAASSTLALRLITTRLVMLCTSGLAVRTACMSAHKSWAVICCVFAMTFLSARLPEGAMAGACIWLHARAMACSKPAFLREHYLFQVQRVFLSRTLPGLLPAWQGNTPGGCNALCWRCCGADCRAHCPHGGQRQKPIAKSLKAAAGWGSWCGAGPAPV